jgi:DUF438 domain-containing protein
VLSLIRLCLDLHPRLSRSEAKQEENPVKENNVERCDELIADVKPTDVAPAEEQLIEEENPAKGVQPLDAELIDLDTGRMAADQVNLLLKHLPVDVAFADESDQIRYFSTRKNPIFERSRDIIGQPVQECHPPEIQDEVNRLITDFKAGKRDEDAYWVRLRGRLVLNRYYALRDNNGAYRGTIEVSEDFTDIRENAGEKGV